MKNQNKNKQNGYGNKNCTNKQSNNEQDCR